MARKYLCVYYDQEEAWNALSDGERGRLLSALIAYAKRGESATLSGTERIMWPVMKVQIDKNAESYADKVKQCSEAGKASANARKRPSTTVNERQRTSTNVGNNNNNNNSNNKNRNNVIKGGSAFAPPTLEDVEAYCRERNNTVDAQRFFDYYTSNGWKVGKNPMKDWKAAVRTWERSGNQSSAPKQEKITNNPFMQMLIDRGEL